MSIDERDDLSGDDFVEIEDKNVTCPDFAEGA